MTPLRVGLMSLAHVHAAGYARLLRQWPGVELLVADPDAGSAPAEERRGRDLAAELGVPIVDSYEELFAWGPAAVVVCAETSRHRPLVELAASHGVSVLCEKPLATTPVDARAMIEACARAGVALMTAYPVRFHPAWIALREAVATGALGKIVLATGTNNGQAPIDSRRWFVDPELAGGGALMDHTVHLADLLDDVLGSQAVEVYACANRIIHGDSVPVETGGLVLVTYANGTVASIDCSWSAPRSFPAWGGLTLTLDGERSSAGFDAFAERFDLFDDRAAGLAWVDFGPDLDALMLEEFLSAVRSGRPAQPDGEVGYRTLEIVAAAQESVRTGRPVALPPAGRT
ncbi:Predicted dehydrogenase [Nakamurella panacisegetis]|uniref:Predicted dehydrogenase n=1 Tax=Nakamurella panacisegetis TaxID=1090615 RepID=A0A1H0QSZ2_9ACTN|nr:Gfo/Idh/MocA family oxidoreductase [Nakamurella panacisegetis]SDP20310.1 Predicted dehydrogenase [Nakamurella panacisegetis]